MNILSEASLPYTCARRPLNLDEPTKFWCHNYSQRSPKMMSKWAGFTFWRRLPMWKFNDWTIGTERKEKKGANWCICAPKTSAAEFRLNANNRCAGSLCSCRSNVWWYLQVHPVLETPWYDNFNDCTCTWLNSCYPLLLLTKFHINIIFPCTHYFCWVSCAADLIKVIFGSVVVLWELAAFRVLPWKPIRQIAMHRISLCTEQSIRICDNREDSS